MRNWQPESQILPTAWFCKQSYGNIATGIHLYVVYGYSLIKVADLNSYNRLPLDLQSLEYLLSGTLQKMFAYSGSNINGSSSQL